MSSKRFLLLTFLIIGMFISAQLPAEDQSGSIWRFLEEERYEQMRALERINNPEMLFAEDFNDFPMYEEDLYKAEHHSIGRAFLYSLILPGAGEIYTGSKFKAAIFLGVEAFSWYQYISNYSKGQDIEDDYRAFANEHWNPGEYRAWLVEELGIPIDTLNEDFAHSLPDFKTQQYYEMIGKYDQFVYGWDDTDYSTGDSLSEKRDEYLKMRDNSNSKFDAAKNYAIVAITNRIISAFDAGLSARKLNKKADRFSSEVKVKARLADYHGERIPKIILTYRFY